MSEYKKHVEAHIESLSQRDRRWFYHYHSESAVGEYVKPIKGSGGMTTHKVISGWQQYRAIDYQELSRIIEGVGLTMLLYMLQREGKQP